MNRVSVTRPLQMLARLCGVQTSYYDVSHHRHQATVDALLAVFRGLGIPLANVGDIPSAWREQRQLQWQRPLSSAYVAWDGEPVYLEMRLPASAINSTLKGKLELEDGGNQNLKWRVGDLPVIETNEVEAIPYAVARLPLSSRLPWGYHRFSLELLGKHDEALIISAPRKAYIPPEWQQKRTWGVFSPLYALYARKSWGSGTITDLETLTEWVDGLGGKVVAILPILATFMDQNNDPSPYLPVSRRLWNELYLDIYRVPELEKCPSAQNLLNSAEPLTEIKELNSSALVDYQRQMALKRQVLQDLCQCHFAEKSDRLEALRRFAKENPVVEDYARFRAVNESQGCPWRSWPQPLRQGWLKEGDYNEGNSQYHLYVQWLIHQQIQALYEKMNKKSLRLYLDLPLGVHPDGYDVWREQNVFVPEISVGAPPDTVFTGGQNWGFPPLHPRKIREQGYRYLTDVLRHHLRHAGMLRIDHVMGLHRLFWIPEGMEPSKGIYVRYPAEELYAILSLESNRHQAIIVGEDLGTVPPEVRPAMNRHNLHRMFVLHYELASNRKRVLGPVSSNSVASLNTHDMFPFTAFWQGLDIEERLKLGLLGGKSAKSERKSRCLIKNALVRFLQTKGWLKVSKIDVHSIIKSCLALLGSSQARVVLVNLEDLWLETRPQNIPGTQSKCPNWRRKMRYPLEKLCQLPQVIDTLRMVNASRRQSRH